MPRAEQERFTMADKKETGAKPKEVSKKINLLTKGTMPTDNSRPLFMQREFPGRDGKGPCSVGNRPLMMPNGDIAPAGSTFDPIFEKMNTTTFKRLLAKKRISILDKKVSDTMFKAETVTKAGGGK